MTETKTLNALGSTAELGYEHMLLPAMLRAIARERDDAVAINALTHSASALERLSEMAQQRREIERLREGIGDCYRMLLIEANTTAALDKAEGLLRELLAPNAQVAPLIGAITGKYTYENQPNRVGGKP